MVGSKILFRGGIIILLCLSFVGLEACNLFSTARVTQEDIIGMWVEERCATSATESAACGYFEFFPDGRFEARDIPTEGFSIRHYGFSRASASGSWELGTPPQDPLDYQLVNLDMKFGRYDFEEKMYISSRGGLSIVADIIDDWGGIFVKKY